MLRGLGLVLAGFWCILPLVLWGVSEVLGPTGRGRRLREMATLAMGGMAMVGILTFGDEHQPAWLQEVNLAVFASPVAPYALYLLKRPLLAHASLLGVIAAVAAGVACRWWPSPSVWLAAFAATAAFFAILRLWQARSSQAGSAAS